MKIMVFGGTGMLGHRLWLDLSKDHSVYGTIRTPGSSWKLLSSIDNQFVINQINIHDERKLSQALHKIRPDVVINAIGIIKQIDESKNHILSMQVNSLFPHQLAKICNDIGARMISFSTDCVFDGTKGHYNEDDYPSAKDLYGKSKMMGEVDYLANTLTIRTSIIGRELEPKGSLIDWFLSQEGKKIKGFANALYTGFPTGTISKILNNIILKSPNLSGIYHISSDPISKYDLLLLVKELYDCHVDIEKECEFCQDRSLDSSKFRKETNFSPPQWSELIKDLRGYDELYKCYS